MNKEKNLIYNLLILSFNTIVRDLNKRFSYKEKKKGKYF